MGFTKKVSYKDLSEPKNMYRLQLGKTTTDFFSSRGKSRLKRIWLDHRLDDEMIFSSWIGPSEAFLRQKVSDYVQAFLIHRSRFGTFRLLENQLYPVLLNGPTFLNSAETCKRNEKYPYYEAHRSIERAKHQEKLKSAETSRIEKSIRNREMSVIPGFQKISRCPIFRAEEIERKIKTLTQIQLPLTTETFEKHALPILTSLAIEDERILEKSKLKVVNKFRLHTTKRIKNNVSPIPKEIPGDSGISSTIYMCDSWPSSLEMDLAENIAKIQLNSDPSDSFDENDSASS